MKSYKNLYPQICTWENLYEAWRKARRGKRGREPAAHFELNLGENLLCLQQELRGGDLPPRPVQLVLRQALDVTVGVIRPYSFRLGGGEQTVICGNDPQG